MKRIFLRITINGRVLIPVDTLFWHYVLLVFWVEALQKGFKG